MQRKGVNVLSVTKTIGLNMTRVATIVLFLACLLLAGCVYKEDNAYQQHNVRAPTPPPRHAYNPTAAKYNVQLGMAYLQKGDTDRAKSKLMIAIEQDPRSSVIMDALAYFFEMTGEEKSAESYYKRAIKLKTQEGVAHNNYGAFLCRQNRFQEAEREFLLAINQPNYISQGEAYENLGLCALKNNDKVKAENFFQQAILKQPRLQSALLELVKLNYEKDNIRRATAYLERYNSISDPTPESIKFAILLAEKENNGDVIASNLMVLKNRFPNSYEYRELGDKYEYRS